MATLDNIIDIQISLQQEAVTREGFGTACFFTVDETFSPGVMKGVYASLEEVADDYADDTAPYLAAVKIFGQGSGFSKYKVYHVDPNEGSPDYAAAITASLDVDSDWYAAFIESASQADNEAVAAAVQAIDRIFIAVSVDAAVLVGATATDVSSEILAAGYFRTSVFHSGNANQWPAAAWLGKMLPEDPGTKNWSFRNLVGVTPVKYTAAQTTALDAKRCNRYVAIAGRNVTLYGYTSSPGYYLDLVRFLDELKVRIQEDIFARLASEDPIPYRGEGPATVESLIRGRLDRYVDAGNIEPGTIVVTVPPAASQEASDRAARIYRNVTFSAATTGFVNNVVIRGTITV